MRLTIIVVNFNTSAFILSCLQSIRDCVCGMEYEVIVVDNRSTDGSYHLIQEKFSDLCLIENTTNLGFARAVNQGFRRAKGEYLLVLNPDVTLTPGSIGKARFFKLSQERGGICDIPHRTKISGKDRTCRQQSFDKIGIIVLKHFLRAQASRPAANLTKALPTKQLRRNRCTVTVARPLHRVGVHYPDTANFHCQTRAKATFCNSQRAKRYQT